MNAKFVCACSASALSDLLVLAMNRLDENKLMILDAELKNQ